MSKGRWWDTTKVCDYLGCSRATLARMREARVFPEPKVLFRNSKGRPTSIRWAAEVVMAWEPPEDGSD
jgi:predicted DNA-binding transcriptional regulator AlpA